jgi:hypothetical protein
MNILFFKDLSSDLIFYKTGCFHKGMRKERFYIKSILKE